MYIPPLVSSTSLLESQRNDANAMAEKEPQYLSVKLISTWRSGYGKGYEGVERVAPLPV